MNSKANSGYVDTEILTLKQVRSDALGFLIPSYQRPYVWSEDDVVKLFDDIREAFLAQEQEYFIGSVLSARRDTNGLRAYELIDGQQRTTTLMLISLAFKAAEVESDLSEVSLLDNQPRLNFTIRATVRDLLGHYAGLSEVTLPESDEIDKDPYLKHLAKNLTVLKQKVDTLKAEAAFDLDGFAEYLYSRVKWVNNIVPGNMDLNRLFSSMNTAGIQLEPVDLLKAKLFKTITTDKALYSTIWQACEHTENYFERNLRQLFPKADWNSLEYKNLACFSPEVFINSSDQPCQDNHGKSLAMLRDEVRKGECPANASQQEMADTEADLDEETVYCRSIISFELLLIHTLRIFCAQKGWGDLEPRIKAGNLMACFECLLAKDEVTIKAFIQLLWQVRYQFDKRVVKWVEHDDREDPQLRLTTFSRSQSSGKYYINRSAKDLSELVQLQAVRNFTGERSAQYWLTALLAKLVEKPDISEPEVLSVMERLDNQLSLTTETQKEASFKIAKGESPVLESWESKVGYFGESKGTSFEHYWFQKLEYLLWKNADKQGGDDEKRKLKQYRITSKNSVEHVHPQNEEYNAQVPRKFLDAFGNLVLLSPGENSSYSNQTVLKKRADFDSKPRYDSLKLKAMFTLHRDSKGTWSEAEIAQHQEQMLALLEEHYR